ncbi:MAG: 23S rRNA (cytosine(1962)-C(5))-methyltransferase RlmI [Rhodocyclaceae bacterium]|nr:23S rRNA (cytosine(1962)-C(5))-methyltransferase RlmI [Rhodocyclaceae bacterium]
MSARLVLARGKEAPQFRRHPWVFANAVDALVGRARPGDTVLVETHDGRPLGRAAWSPASQIRARMWTFDADERIDDAFFRRRIDAAVACRVAHPSLAGQDGMRLVHGEADQLPGVIVDRYRDTLVVALNSAGADKWRAAIVGALLRATGAAHVHERSDSDGRRLEGLPPRAGTLHGDPPRITELTEHGVRLRVDLAEGHKTGFYLDQRDNRRLTRDLAAGRRVLNCFCYTGGFSLQALAGGARAVLSVDSSAPALAAAQASLMLNPGLDAGRASWREADVFELLRELKSAGEKFDLLILDPPKFAPSSAHAERASRAYRDINRLGFQLLAPGGLLMTYSCSGGVSAERFRNLVAAAACDADVEAQVLQHLQAGPDHPVALAAPEGAYLKGLLVRRP